MDSQVRVRAYARVVVVVVVVRSCYCAKKEDSGQSGGRIDFYTVLRTSHIIDKQIETPISDGIRN